MDETNPQRGVPPPGRTQVRIGATVFEISDSAWEEWVRHGRIPPDALMISGRWTRGVWRKAGALEAYHLFLPPMGLRQSTGTGQITSSYHHPPRAGSFAISPRDRILPDLPRAIWGKGVSITHMLFALNLVVSACLAWLWRGEYLEKLWAFSATLRGSIDSGWIPVLVIPLFLHASAQHLLGNLLSLVAGGAAVEEFYGRKRTLFLYLVSGLCGATFSLLLREKPVLSVGASGAIMGMYGVILLFLIRFRGRFSERQRFKTARIYLPLVALAVLPSVFHADLLSHVGGFLGGAIMGLIIPPRPDLVPWTDAPGAAHERPHSGPTPGFAQD